MQLFIALGTYFQSKSRILLKSFNTAILIAIILCITSFDSVGQKAKGYFIDSTDNAIDVSSYLIDYLMK